MRKTLLLIALCAIAGIGAFFMFRKGAQEKEEQEQKAELIGLTDITIQEGESLPGSVSEVRGTWTVKEVRVDASEVNVRKPGKYPIIYHYTDISGKEHQEEILCTVEEKPEEEEGAAKQEEEEGVSEIAAAKTGDESRIMLLAGMAGASLAVICLMAVKREKRI